MPGLGVRSVNSKSTPATPRVAGRPDIGQVMRMPEAFRLERTLLRVSGPGAREFLQGLLTQDVGRLEASPVIYGALLTPQGKLSADMLIWRSDDGMVIETAPSFGERLLQRLNLYKLRAPVAIEDASAELAAVWGPAPFDAAVADPRMPSGSIGWRALMDRATAERLQPGDEAFDQLRILAGVPDLARDAGPEEVFALEALLEELNGVDFSKGCFVGQENVSRMKRRATTRKKFCPVLFAGAPPPHGAVVSAGEAELGSIRSGAGERALALLRLDRAAEAIASGGALTASGRLLRLDPPDWLVLPATSQAS